MMLDAMSRETELEDVTDALLLTGNDDFDALAALALRTELGHGRVYRAAPDIDETDLLAPAGEQGILGADMLTSAELGRRFAAGARLVEEPVNGGASDGDFALFVVTAAGDLRVARRQAAGGEGGRPGHRARGGRMIGARVVDWLSRPHPRVCGGRWHRGDLVPGAGMVGCSLRHRGEELLGQRRGLRAYVADRATMGIPLLYPWANRVAHMRSHAGREVAIDPEATPLHRDADGLAMHGLLGGARMAGRAPRGGG